MIGWNIQYFRRMAAIARSCSVRSATNRAVPSMFSPANLWCLLHVLHPLAIYVRSTDVKPVAIQNEPDRNFVRLPGFAPVMGQPRRLLSGYPPQSRKFGRFLKLSLATCNMNQQSPLNVPKLCLRHAEVVPQFMYESLANLVTHFGLA